MSQTQFIYLSMDCSYGFDLSAWNEEKDLLSNFFNMQVYWLSF